MCIVFLIVTIVVSLIAVADSHSDAFKTVVCSPNEGDAEICESCKQRFRHKYPLNAADLKRSFLFSDSDICRWKPLVDKLNSRKILEVAVIGGSMTFGHNCNDAVSGHFEGCAWPNRLERLLKTLSPNYNFSIHNYARPSWGYERWLADGIWRDLHPDLFIIDLAVNSQTYRKQPLQLQRALDLFLFNLQGSQQELNNSCAVLFVETFRTCSVHLTDCDLHCSVHEQGKMLTNLTTFSYSWCNGWWSIQDFELPVLKHYGIPVASYRDAVWPDLAVPVALLPCFWNGMSHADAVAHILIADVVFYALKRLFYLSQKHDLGSSCDEHSKHLPYHQHLVMTKYCADSSFENATTLSINDAANFIPLFNKNWNLTEDRPGKLGWIVKADSLSKAAQPINNFIAFAVSLSSSPQLEVTYLQTYENFGRVNMFIGRSNFTSAHIEEALAKYELNGFTKEHWSTPKTSTFVRNASIIGSDVEILPDTVYNGRYIVLFVLLTDSLASKFKLLDIASC